MRPRRLVPPKREVDQTSCSYSQMASWISHEIIAAIGIPIIWRFDVLGDVLAYFTQNRMMRLPVRMFGQF